MSDKTLHEARDELLRQLDEGTTCPCCGQFAKVYPRRISSAVARAMIQMYLQVGEEWMHVSRLRQAGGDYGKARYWGLLEQAEGEREDGSSRNGYWRLTPRGTAFVEGRLRIPKYARIFAGRLLGLDDAETVSVHDTLGHRFDYRELMGR